MPTYWPNKDVLSVGKQALANDKPSKELLGYLKSYQQDLLTTGTPEELPSFASQLELLITAMRHKYAKGQGFHQIINGRALGLTKFWELLLSLDFVSHEIKLADNIGYDDKEIFPGLRSKVEAPYAEFTITGEDLKQKVAREPELAKPTRATNIVTAEPESHAATHEGNVFMRGRFVCIAIAGDDTYTIGALEKDRSQYNFMKYLIDDDNTDIDISINDIKALKGLAAVSNLSELARHCGFPKSYKRAFFPTSTANKVRFTKVALLSDKQVDGIKRQAAQIADKS